MRTLTLLFTFVALQQVLHAQGTIKLTVTLLDNRGAFLPGAVVTFKEASGKGKLQYTSGATGMVTATFDSGKEWQMYVNNFYTKRVVEVPESGSGEMSMTYTYNPDLAKRLARQVYDRSGFTEEVYEYTEGKYPPEGKGTLKIKLVDEDKRELPGVKVTLVDVKDKTTLTTTTDKKGYASFWGKLGQEYDIDVADMMNVSYSEVNREAMITTTETVRFQPVQFTEKIKGDTVVQNLNGVTEPATGYQFCELIILKDGIPAANEPVYIQQIKGTRVYTGKTDGNGSIQFMLPFHQKYMVAFRFQRDVDVIDLMDVHGSSKREMLLTYIPNPRLEHPEMFIPKSDQLFLTEFQHFLTKQYPKTDRPVGLHLEFGGPVNSQSKEAVLEIGVNTNGAESQSEINVCFVMDNSGSMAGYNRIESLKLAMNSLISKLPESATVSLILYSDDMVILLEPVRLGKKKASVVTLINDVQPGGSTNMLNALKQGYEFVKKNYNPTAVNKVVVFTDGWDNNEVAVLENVQKPYTGIECSTVGIGEDFNYALLKILATNGKGKLIYVENDKSFESVFVSEMMGSLAPAATDVTIEITYNDHLVFKHLYGFTPESTGGNPVKFRLPNLYSGSNEIALAKFDLVSPTKDIEKQPVIITVSYFNTITGKKESYKEKVFLKWEDYTGELELIADAERRKLYVIAVMNQSIKVMAEFFTQGKNDEAQKTIQRAYEQIKKIYPAAADEDVKKLLATVEEYLQAFKNLALLSK